MEQRKRATFINALSGAKPAFLLGTVSAGGNTNCAIFNSVLHIGANPPLMGFILRPATVERHSYDNIRETGCFTLNHVPASLYQQAHQTSAKYPRTMSEFAQCGLNELYTDGFAAPFVGQSPLQIGLRFVEEHTLPVNATILIIGEVEHVFSTIPPDQSGHIRFDETANVASVDSYYTQSFLETLPYARFTE
ncbi:MAG: flavin reductase [Candidatus Kapabacteria bacterium]|nr:flavin reductase [Candidatus Kapabacteria bacterium]